LAKAFSEKAPEQVPGRAAELESCLRRMEAKVLLPGERLEAPVRHPNKDLRTREHFTPKEGREGCQVSRRWRCSIP
jgi:hypothetical protein